MATQMQQAREGRITDAMKIVAQEEHIPVETIRERVANGTIAICANVNHENLRPRGVGEGLRVKVNANIGTSSTFPDIEPELEKLDEAVRCGAPPGGGPGFWAGVNTSVPNRMIEAAFLARRLGFAKGYTAIRREVRRGESRLDALLTGPGLPPLWVECKNVTLVEDGMACFPDAATVRGQKHLRELMDIVSSGERGAMFYLVQRPDGRCFGPAAFIAPDYAALFWQALRAGVEVYPYEAFLSEAGIGLGGLLPLAKPDCPDVTADSRID